MRQWCVCMQKGQKWFWFLYYLCEVMGFFVEFFVASCRAEVENQSRTEWLGDYTCHPTTLISNSSVQGLSKVRWFWPRSTNNVPEVCHLPCLRVGDRPFFVQSAQPWEKYYSHSRGLCRACRITPRTFLLPKPLIFFFFKNMSMATRD